jgi:hypothetical protein
MDVNGKIKVYHFGWLWQVKNVPPPRTSLIIIAKLKCATPLAILAIAARLAPGRI